ncbi:MAG: hypothetical protein RR835_11930 [Peptostreptococcaceae bacterium]
MYRVKLKYIDVNELNSIIIFDCEQFNIDYDKYQFKNIVTSQFILTDLEVDNKDIALIKII